MMISQWLDSIHRVASLNESSISLERLLTKIKLFFQTYKVYIFPENSPKVRLLQKRNKQINN